MTQWNGSTSKQNFSYAFSMKCKRHTVVILIFVIQFCANEGWGFVAPS